MASLKCACFFVAAAEARGKHQQATNSLFNVLFNATIEVAKLARGEIKDPARSMSSLVAH